MELPEGMPKELKATAEIYNELEITCGWDENDILRIVIKSGYDVNKFIPVAIRYWENLSDIEGPQTAIIINQSGESSKEFQFNTDSELTRD